MTNGTTIAASAARPKGASNVIIRHSDPWHRHSIIGAGVNLQAHRDSVRYAGRPYAQCAPQARVATARIVVKSPLAPPPRPRGVSRRSPDREKRNRLRTG